MNVCRPSVKILLTAADDPYILNLSMVSGQRLDRRMALPLAVGVSSLRTLALGLELLLSSLLLNLRGLLLLSAPAAG